MAARMPVVFIPHGGGPWPFVEMGIPADQREPLAEYLRGVAATCRPNGLRRFWSSLATGRSPFPQ